MAMANGIARLFCGFKTKVPVRYTSTRVMCPYVKPCSDMTLNIKGCDLGMPRKSPKLVPPIVPFKSMWENPECCVEVCKAVEPRFDEKYYRPSDKWKTTYYRTWEECPTIVCRPKKVCCRVREDPPKRRPRQKPKTAGPHRCMALGCPSIESPGCRKARKPPKCSIVRAPKDCKKIKAPSPSFSECKKPKPNPKHPVECECLKLVALCDIYAAQRLVGGTRPPRQRFI